MFWKRTSRLLFDAMKDGCKYIPTEIEIAWAAVSIRAQKPLEEVWTDDDERVMRKEPKEIDDGGNCNDD